jgi:hypothetical protein
VFDPGARALMPETLVLPSLSALPERLTHRGDLVAAVRACPFGGWAHQRCHEGALITKLSPVRIMVASNHVCQSFCLSVWAAHYLLRGPAPSATGCLEALARLFGPVLSWQERIVREVVAGRSSAHKKAALNRDSRRLELSL